MRDRRLLVLIGVSAGIVAFGVYAVTGGSGTDAVVATTPRPETPAGDAGRQPPPPPSPSSTPPPSSPPPLTTPAPPPGPEGTAARYFDAWRAGDLVTMGGLVADPPPDFADLHRRFDSDLRVTSLSITPGAVRPQGTEAADVPFEGLRVVAGLGPWPFSSVLHLTLRDGAWKVLWGLDTLHPALRDGGGLRLRETQVRRPATLTREGKPFPLDSKAGDYITGLNGTAVDLSLEEEPSGRVLLESPAPPPSDKRSTISLPVQAAAARVLDGVGQPAAIVAVDAETGQVRAVADTLGGRRAFNGLYPPGSTFKVVTAAALLRSGLTPDTTVPCPASYTIPNARSFTNGDRTDHGAVSLSRAFALSCNTAFVQQTYERLRDGQLRSEAADRFGFREKPGLSSCRILAAGTPDELGSDAIGQNSVQASPLCMAEVAAAVASGVWKPAIMSAEPPPDSPAPVPVDPGVLAGLRAMMREVVTGGTAAQAGLPPDTYGKTGTAEVAGQGDHAWFIGYRGSLAFAVFVANGGGGGAAAAPVAARFLDAL
ncbi:penicillin-binding protein [Microtetraspora sp. NBRC 13810]|uniref:penicillin-binding transpeptidase domain-containing protein n=1 Tax=Microtetraspora sp. NBRC 13810 TaxID=3030990 RepID=UPI0024A1F16E|nr:penicillin-binding transpeptidase domain-containing protein [Microtetraspora sp. NBRC 13810]GLW10760.1 penicillin-binding protein [Microtetraspora sp. NBRC 13810]